MSKVRCPVCGALVKQKFIEGHIGGKHPKPEPRGPRDGATSVQDKHGRDLING